MGRVSREQAAENRARVVAAAAALFRRKGVDGVSINELMAEVGLTHGGFAGQFGTKEALAGEACALAFDGAVEAWEKAAAGDATGRLARLVEFYLTPKPPGQDCPMATLAGDVAHAPPGSPVRRAFDAGLHRMADMVAGDPPDERALVGLAALVGAAVLRRAAETTALPDAIEDAVRKFAAPSAPR